MTEVREIVLIARMREICVSRSSWMPSVKNRSSSRLLRFSNGSTAMDLRFACGESEEETEGAEAEGEAGGASFFVVTMTALRMPTAIAVTAPIVRARPRFPTGVGD